jgi:hypothetical protein
MTTAAAIPTTKVETLLTDLLGRQVDLHEIELVEPHSSTARGLITDDDELVAVIASDLPFAHLTGAALAMVPAAKANEAVDDPDEELMEFYIEVANVLSRAINEAMHPVRVRIDPGVDHPVENLQHLVAKGSIVTSVAAAIEGYGEGRLGIWQAR